jgi:heptaprenylglyceryl phosphate synthase
VTYVCLRADIIVTGTIAEKDPEALARIIRAVKGKR